MDFHFESFPEFFRLCFFLRSVHTFSWFLKSKWSSVFVRAETGSGAKKRVVFRRDFFRFKFKVEWENGVWTKIRFLASGFFVHMRQFDFDFYCFFVFLDRIFFSMVFSHPFIVRARSSFLFSQWKFFVLYVRTCPAMFFLINFIGVIFEAGNGTREKNWSDFGAE